MVWLGRPRFVFRGAALVSLVAAMAAGACGSEESKERFDDDDAAGGYGAAPTGTTTGTSTGTTTGTSTGTATGTSTGAGTTTGTGTPSCDNDGFEPNDSESEAVFLGEVSDCSGNEGVIDGVLEGTEYDWFEYSGLDNFGVTCQVGAHVEWQAAGTVRVCSFFECEGLSFDCPDGTTAEVSGGGRSGCCGTEAYTVSPDCSGLDDAATVFIRVDKPPTPYCQPYTLTYNY